ncbi:hypothetical protein NLU13_4319 [Sarocladium strictum]|uniref:D-serine dehydratase-like domain-containing protein n=1 Tax=Sarocladium strictum TaxID=5046 RepID=A0AA39GIM6_SARSR|nr:hypothetical protein NLU13_4319 [Sarocladium strictum]
MSSTVFYPSSPKESLAALYVGKSLHDVPTPAVVMDVAAARRNCQRMLDACQTLGVSWRAHVKTHKTEELTQLQVGTDVERPVNLVVSTLSEAEFLLPLLKEYRSQGRAVNVLYGLPISRNALGRLAAVARALGEGSISVLLDDPAQLSILSGFRGLSGVTPRALMKVDMGGRRAGVIVESSRFNEVAEAAVAAHERGEIILSGLYSHAGQSYAGDSRVAALKMMGAEIGAMLEGADRVVAMAKGLSVPLPSLVLSGGASPTALSIQNLVVQSGGQDANQPAEVRAEAAALSQIFETVKQHGHITEIHAGVYPTLDLQQLAAHSISSSRLSWRDIALTVLAEIHSVYPGRGENGKSEALMGAGGLALGREFCKAYDGFAMVTPWGRPGVEMPKGDVEEHEGWICGRFSQEHGILTWGGGNKSSAAGLAKGDDHAGKTAPTPRAPPVVDELRVGQVVRLWPNHACITSSHFGWYFVVDSDREGREDEIVDCWMKARGW